jgi:hypothetical protein
MGIPHQPGVAEHSCLPSTGQTTCDGGATRSKLGLGGGIAGVAARRSGLYLPDRLPLRAWQKIGEQVSLVADSAAWWLGDWLLYGQSHYVNRYKQAIEQTSLDYQTLRNYAWVARRFPMSRRRDSLSFGHHAEAAALPTADQVVWFDRAELFGWSRNELRKRIRASRGAAEPGRPPPVVLQVAVAPEREHRWQEAASRMNQQLEEWVALVLDEAAEFVLVVGREDGHAPDGAARVGAVSPDAPDHAEVEDSPGDGVGRRPPLRRVVDGRLGLA